VDGTAKAPDGLGKIGAKGDIDRAAKLSWT